MADEFEREIKDDVKINRFKLEMIAEEHSSIYHYWSSLLAEAKTKVDRKIERVKQLKAEKFLHYKSNPAEDCKPTDKSVEIMVDNDMEVRDARIALITAKSYFNGLDAAVLSLEHKKKEIENLKDLYIHNYYSGNNPKNLTDQAGQEASNQLNKEKEKK